MLHIVQVVLSGGVEVPQVFVEQSQAEAAFVACAKQYWKQSYASFCEKAGSDADSYATAQAFVASFDLAERSRIHVWSVPLETAGADDLEHLLPGVAVLQKQREQIQRLVDEVAQAAGVVREGITEVLGVIAGMPAAAEPATDKQPPTVERNQPGRLKSVAPPTVPSTPQTARTELDSEKRKAYVGSIMIMCGGNRSEYKLFTRSDWRKAVYDNEATLEYWGWVTAQIDAHIEKAQQAGYSVIDDSEQSGCYWFQTPDGVVSETPCKAEGEAWCRAGLHLEGSQANSSSQ
jgi:hypothetical protein